MYFLSRLNGRTKHSLVNTWLSTLFFLGKTCILHASPQGLVKSLLRRPQYQFQQRMFLTWCCTRRSSARSFLQQKADESDRKTIKLSNRLLLHEHFLLIKEKLYQQRIYVLIACLIEQLTVKTNAKLTPIFKLREKSKTGIPFL